MRDWAIAGNHRDGELVRRLEDAHVYFDGSKYILGNPLRSTLSPEINSPISPHVHALSFRTLETSPFSKLTHLEQPAPDVAIQFDTVCNVCRRRENDVFARLQ